MMNTVLEDMPSSNLRNMVRNLNHTGGDAVRAIGIFSRGSGEVCTPDVKFAIYDLVYGLPVNRA